MISNRAGGNMNALGCLDCCLSALQGRMHPASMTQPSQQSSPLAFPPHPLNASVHQCFWSNPQNTVTLSHLHSQSRLIGPSLLHGPIHCALALTCPAAPCQANPPWLLPPPGSRCLAEDLGILSRTFPYLPALLAKTPPTEPASTTCPLSPALASSRLSACSQAPRRVLLHKAPPPPHTHTLSSPPTIVSASSWVKMPALQRALAYAWLPCTAQKNHKQEDKA